MNLPPTRTKDIIVQSTGNELLVYDLNTNKAFILNETAANVFNYCDGKHTFDEVKNKHQYTDDLIFLTLDELKRNDLIDGEVGNNFPKMTRREAAKRVGLATMIALPAISALTAPLAAHAQSANSNSSGNVCIDNGCADRTSSCNGGAGCAALGAGYVCCFALGSCACTTVDTCSFNRGAVCPAVPD